MFYFEEAAVEGCITYQLTLVGLSFLFELTIEGPVKNRLDVWIMSVIEYHFSQKRLEVSLQFPILTVTNFCMARPQF